MLAQGQLVLVTQTDAIDEQLQLDHEPMQGEAIFSSLRLNCWCWAGSDPEIRNVVLITAVPGSCWE